jgi:hypothetical protein
MHIMHRGATVGRALAWITGICSETQANSIPSITIDRCQLPIHPYFRRICRWFSSTCTREIHRFFGRAVLFTRYSWCRREAPPAAARDRLFRYLKGVVRRRPAGYGRSAAYDPTLHKRQRSNYCRGLRYDLCDWFGLRIIASRLLSQGAPFCLLSCPPATGIPATDCGCYCISCIWLYMCDFCS